MTLDNSIPVDGPRPRLSKLAVTAISLAPLLAMGTVGFGLFLWTDSFKPGLGGLAQFIIFAGLVIIGGSITAAIAIVLGCVAQRQIAKQPKKFRGHRQARIAVNIGAFSLLCVWGIIGTNAAIQSIREAPFRVAEADIRATFDAVVAYSRKNDTFPDTLEQVVSAGISSRYIYLGKSLPSEYADYQTVGSKRIVLMYSNQSIDGKVVAICANGMTHKWTKPVLEGALRESDRLRSLR